MTSIIFCNNKWTDYLRNYMKARSTESPLAHSVFCVYQIIIMSDLHVEDGFEHHPSSRIPLHRMKFAALGLSDAINVRMCSRLPPLCTDLLQLAWRAAAISPWGPGTGCSGPCPRSRAPPGWWCCRSRTWCAGGRWPPSEPPVGRRSPLKEQSRT